MKKIQSIPVALIVLASMFSVVVFFSCTGNRIQQTAVKTALSGKDIAHIEQQEFVASRESDAEFLSETAAINLREIKMGQLARQKSTNEEIILLANTMEAEHLKTLQEIEALAAQKNINLPLEVNETIKKHYEQLNVASGVDFDKAYTRLLINGHREAIMLFEKRIRETKDIDINNWIEKTLPSLRKYLEHSEQCEKSV